MVAGPHPDLVLDVFVEVGQLLGRRCRVVVGGVVGPWRIVLARARPVDPVVGRRRAGWRVPGHVEDAGGVAGQCQSADGAVVLLDLHNRLLDLHNRHDRHNRLLDRHNRLLDRHDRLGGDLSGCLGPGSAPGVLGAGAVVVAGPHPDLVLDVFVEVGQLLGRGCRVEVGGVVGP